MDWIKGKCQAYKFDKETTVFLLFLAGMAVYYGWRMFALTPWYDELYTYYYFISRGPVYAAIHWPLPNNHIGYSVLSACLGVFGNAAIALRGVSCLCSLGSLILIFRLGRKCLARGMALIPVFLYAGMGSVNQLAVQGRGYALVTFCYLTALWELWHMAIEGRIKAVDHILFGLSLVMALYAIPSSLYVVIPVCLAGGAALLLNRDGRGFVRLLVTSLISAFCTVGLYGIVWLAIGSNLLVKTEGSGFYGMGHVAVICRAPFTAVKTGIEYMLATPYIQSVGRAGYLEKFAQWLRNLLNGYYAGGALVLAAVLLIAAFLSIVGIVRRCKEDIRTPKEPCSGHNGIGGTCFVEIYLTCSIIGIPLMLVVMCSLPYYRVFSFAGAVAAFAAAWLWQKLAEQMSAVTAKCGKSGAVGSAVCGALCIFLLCTPAYRAQYSSREAAIEDAYEHVDLTRAGRIGVTDCDQEYLLLFLYGIGEERITRVPEEAEVILADKYLLLDYDTDVIDWSGDDWKLYLSPEQFAESGVMQKREAVYENDRFILFQ